MSQRGFGTIIILNGTSSSGKTSIVKALQLILEKPFLEAGLDKFIFMLPEAYLERPNWDDVLGLADKAGTLGHMLVNGMHNAIEALSLAGINVIADHVLVEPAWLEDCVNRFIEYPTYFIGVKCPLEVLEKREKARKNRTAGQAKLQHGIVHRGCVYDLEVDTSRSTADECATAIKAYIHQNPVPGALKEMSSKLHN
jgi:chloramphenicol 3-O phosphotransferase